MQFDFGKKKSGQFPMFTRNDRFSLYAETFKNLNASLITNKAYISDWKEECGLSGISLGNNVQCNNIFNTHHCDIVYTDELTE